ncbi:MAG: SAM-dependent methyltransferase [Cyanobacteria bacterium P01_F01_bin.53]
MKTTLNKTNTGAQKLVTPATLQPQNLQQAITQKIEQAQQQRITFAEFMEMALYHPQFGYYSTPGSIIGPQGDFITSPHMGHDFGEVIVEQFADMWDALDRPETFTLMEMGAGQGLVAADAIAHLQKHHPDCFACLHYIVVEKSDALRAEQKKRLSHWIDKGVELSWQTLTDIPTHSIVGCAFSNELVDAFPVHWVELHDQDLKEMWVTVHDQTFTAVLGELSTPQLKQYFQNLEIDLTQGYEDSYRTEVNLAALEWMSQVSEKVKRGYVLTIDYGYTAQRYYSPARSQGTLQCYYRHSHHNDPFAYVGEQDITAHVDFTTLENCGKSVGLETLGFTQQGLFLMALGLGDRLSALANPTQQPAQDKPAKPTEIQAIMRRREALQQLISPMGLGNFGVLIQGKGLTPKEIARPLKGLAIPPLF